MKTDEIRRLEEAKKLAEKKSAMGQNVDELIEIGEADGFKLDILRREKPSMMSL